MPSRKFPIEVGGIYHIVNRGVEKRKIYMNNQNYSRFTIGLEFCNHEERTNLWPLLYQATPHDIDALVTPGVTRHEKRSIAERLAGERNLIQKLQKSGKGLVEILAFCLMPNHFHFIIREIKKGGLTKFMIKMGGYSKYFNEQYKRVGPLFQSRFKAVPVLNEQQLYRVFCYVHTNPVELWERGWKNFEIKNKREAIKKLNEYKWSSYRDYIGKPTHTMVTQRDFFLEFFGGSQGCQDAVEDWIRAKAGIEHPNFGEEIIE